MLRVFAVLLALFVALPAVAQNAAAPTTSSAAPASAAAVPAAPAAAAPSQETSAEPTWSNLLHTMVRFNAFDLSDQTLIDEYGVVTECDLYKNFFNDDFKWNQVRQAMRKSAQINAAVYPVDYHYDTKLQLDRYDFNSKMFKLTEKSRINNANAFTILSVQGTDCANGDVKYMPRIFRVVISSPLYMDGLPLSEQDAKAVLEHMDAIKNFDRIVYARFVLRFVYIAKWQKFVEHKPGGDVIHYGQENKVGQDFRVVRIDAQLSSVEFYADPDRTKLIYKFEL